MRHLKAISLGGAIAAVVLAMTPAAAIAESGNQSPVKEPVEEPITPTFSEISFAHPVSLESATTVARAAGLPVEGYHFESDSIVGDFWLNGGLTVEEFLAEVRKETGTAPEIVTAYVDGEAFTDKREHSRGLGDVVIGADLPVYDAPDAVAPADRAVAERSSAADLTSDVVASAAAGDTWQPNDAQVMITDMGQSLSISSQYSWWSSDPYASPLAMADHWGMEFQVDFYTANRPWPPGTPNWWLGKDLRPNCSGADYKDWAAASNRPFDWFGWVIDGTNVVSAPGALGLYGDYNDLSDPCNVSTVAVGMAQPWAMPSGTYGTNTLMIYSYPLRGQETQSRVGSIVQPVTRHQCENQTWMPLTDCMGVTELEYPGPGTGHNRMVLNADNNNQAPDLCWYSGEFGTVPAQIWSCSGPY
ncbi:MAG: hypothetical protein IE935_02325 [Micrococcales bacterium]|nr:hypothetical protein [Micrococcales bacterium]